MKLRELLGSKDFKYRFPVTVRPDATIAVAIKKLKVHDRGSLPVCNDKGELVGIITERDIMRKCFTGNEALTNIKIQDVMSKQVVIGHPEDDLGYAISVMKQERIRHLPVLNGDLKVIGMVSMRDLLGVQLDESSMQVRFLSDYISGSGD